MLSDLQIHVPVPFAFRDREDPVSSLLQLWSLPRSCFAGCHALPSLNHKMVTIGRDLWKPFMPRPLHKTGSPRTSCSRQLLASFLNISEYGDLPHIHYSVQHHDFKWKPRQFSFFIPYSECFLSLIHTQWIFVAFFYSYVLFLLA